MNRFGILLLALLVTAPTAGGQEVGAYAFAGRSSDEHLGDPFGVGVRATWFPIRYLGVRFEYGNAESSATWTGTTCDAYWPEYANCGDEVVRNEADYEIYEWALVASPLRTRGWRAEIWAGISKVDFRYAIRGVETGRVLDRSDFHPIDRPEFNDLLDYFGKGHSATAWGVGLAREGIGGVPVVLGVEWRRRSGPEVACGTDSYCPSWHEGVPVDEVRAHLGWSFGTWQWGP